MRNERRLQASGPSETQHRLHCTCRPIRWSSPALTDDVDPADLPCGAFAAASVAPKPEPRHMRRRTTWDWTAAGSPNHRRPRAA